MKTTLRSRKRSTLKTTTALLFWCVAMFSSVVTWGQAGTYTRINSLAELTDGYYVITHNDAIAMNSTHNGTFLAGTSVSPVANQLVNPNTAIIWQIQTDGASKTVRSANTSKYVSYTGSDNNIQVVDAVSGNNQRWNITHNGTKFLFNNAAVTGRRLQYNTSSPRFAAYTGSQQDLILYKLTPSTVAPTVTTSAVTELTATSATLGGNVTATGGAAIEQNGSVYSPTATNNNPSIGGTGVINLATAAPAAGTGTFSNPTGSALSANMQYSYKAYATNSVGTSYGNVINFYTLANVPGTPTVSNPTTSSIDVLIDVNGNPENTTFAIMEAGGQYVQSNGTLGAGPFWQTASSWANGTVSGLNSNTEYTFSVIARNSALVSTSASQSQSGTTLELTSPILVVGTLPAFGDVCIGESSIGSFSFDGDNLTAEAITIGALEGFAYSLNEMGPYTSTLEIPSLETMTDQVVWVQFSPTMTASYDGMIALSGGGVTSEYNVAASGAGVNTAAMVVTGEESNVTSLQATLDGTFTMGCSDVTAFGIEYSTENNFVTGTQVAGTVEDNGNFAVTVTGLEPNTVYYYKAYATDETGTVYGSQMDFTTQNLAMPTATPGTNVTSDSFVANWIAVPGATSYRIDVSTSETFGTSAPATTTTETFEGIAGGTSSGYFTRTWTGVNGISWTAYKSRTDQSINGSGAITLRDQPDSYIISDVISGGVSNITFTTQQFFSGSGGELTVTVLTGAAYDVATVVGTQPYTTAVSNFNSGALSINGNYKIRIDNNAAARPAIDNLAFTSMPSNIPSFVIENGDAGSGTSFEVTGLEQDTQYYYRVRATTETTASVNSNVIEVKTAFEPLTFEAISIEGPVCDGQVATFTLSGLAADTVQIITYTIGEGSSQTLEVTSDEEGMATFTLELNAAMNGEEFTVTMITREDNTGGIDVTEDNSVTLVVTDGNTYYADADGDTYGDINAPIVACTQPQNAVSNSSDCDDTNPAVYQNADLFIDNDGDGYTAGVAADVCYGATIPAGYAASSLGSDCDDNDAAAWRTADLFVDLDGDGYHSGEEEEVCYGEEVPAGYSENTLGEDCNDENASINPGATEIPNNGIDENCNPDDDGEIEGQTTVIKPSQCGATLSNIYTAVVAVPSVSDVTMYSFEITDENNMVQSISAPVNYFQLTDLEEYEYEMNYSIRVGLHVNGVWQGYGTACTVRTPDLNIVIPQCGTTLAQRQSPIFITGPHFISSFQIRVTNQSTLATQTITRTLSWFNLKMFPQADYAYSTSYSVEVRVATTGEYSEWTPACTITTPAAPGGRAANTASTVAVVAYPNPYNDTFTLNLQSSSEESVQVKVYDMVGKLLEVRDVEPTDLEAQRLGNAFPAGVYNVVVTQGGVAEALRVIKR